MSDKENVDMSDVEGENIPQLAIQTDPSYYPNAAAYWDNIPATIDGVLGGFGHVSSTDINGSECFLRNIFKLENSPGHGRAVDCGAGIGRITKHLLQKHFGKVDLVEQCQSFVDEAKRNFKNSKKIGNIYCMGLQDFCPEPNTYDIIWCQWVLGHLTDEHLVNFFKRMGKGLCKNGVIVVKENVSSDEVEVDEEDFSVTRPESLLLELIQKAGMKVTRNIYQRHFPKSLFKVKIISMHPI